LRPPDIGRDRRCPRKDGGSAVVRVEEREVDQRAPTGPIDRAVRRSAGDHPNIDQQCEGLLSGGTSLTPSPGIWSIDPSQRHNPWQLWLPGHSHPSQLLIVATDQRPWKWLRLALVTV